MKYAFFTGMGRSGTKFMTTLLNESQNVKVVHEYIGNREFWLLSWYMDQNVYTHRYLKRAKNDIDSQFKTDLFIDVNGYLQNSVPLLHEIFEPVKVFHFVRNPKEVVRSLYTRRNEADVHLIPKTGEEIDQWLTGDKFTRICWNWVSTTKILLKQETDLICFEKVISDYNYLLKNVLEPLDIDLSEQVWERIRNQKVNKTRSSLYRKLYARLKGKPFIEDKLPEYEYWPEIRKQQFSEICGAVMKACGYEI